ncbi:MAG: hypothetical protein AAGC55_31595 [Myxococcota bacterium]
MRLRAQINGSADSPSAQASVHGELRGNLLDLDKARICWAIGRLARLWRRVNDLPGRPPVAAIYPAQPATANVAKLAREMAKAGAPVDPQQLYNITGFQPAPEGSAE